MRVANKTIYDSIKFDLSRFTEELNRANKVVSSGKKIIEISDDPVGLSQVLNIRSSLANIEQMGRNIDLGKSWLGTSENALNNVQQLVSRAKTLSNQMATETMGASQRASAAEEVRNILEEIVSLADTEVNGQYIFAGTETRTSPFSLDDPDNPTSVAYSGNHDTFSVKIGKDTSVAVGRDGEDIFLDQVITIDTTNNKIDFMEHSLGASSAELNAAIATGEYTHAELAAAVEQAMETVSAQSGLNAGYTVSYDSDTKNFTIQDDGTTAGFEVELLWNTGSNSDTSLATDMGFDKTDLRDGLISSDNAVVSVTVDATNDTIEFKEDLGDGLGSTLTATLAHGVYNTDVLLGNLAADIETQMEAASAAAGNNADYEVTYDTVNDRFIIEEQGPNLQLKELQILWTSSSAATDLGFDNASDDIYNPPASDNDVEWGIFNTLLDLKGFLESNDLEGISRSITRLNTNFNQINTKISDLGSKLVRMENKKNIYQDLNLTNTDRLSKIEDADVVEAITDLKEKEVAYKSALSASARVLELSLINYM